MNFNASDKTSAHYFTRQEIFRLYAELRLLHPDGVNFAALYHAIMKHPNLSRTTRLMGNNFDHYVRHKASNEKLKQMRQDFNEALAMYDHELTDPVVISNPCHVMEAFWVSGLAYETMDFAIPFIRFSTPALADSVLTFCAEIAEEHGDLLEADSKLYDGKFEFTTRGGDSHRDKTGMTIELPQLLWDAMVDRDVAVLYTEKYITTLVTSEMGEADDDLPPNRRLH
jgi:hypothetical protein